MDILAWTEKEASLSSHAEYILFLEMTASGILQLLAGSERPIDPTKLSSKASVKEFLGSVGEHEVADVVQFVAYSLPSTTHNMVLSPPHVPPTLGSGQVECLYANHALQAQLLASPQAATLLRVLLTYSIGLADRLKPTLQATLLTATMNYFMVLHPHKEHQAVELFIQCYNWIEASVKYTLTSELSLFLRVAAKIGKKKMVERMVANSEWLRSV